MRKKVFAAAGATSLFLGPGRKEFDPSKPLPSFETHLLETAKETLSQIPSPQFDEGIIGSFMSGAFIHQGNLPGFLPFMVEGLFGKGCTAVEGACGTGGRAIAMAVRSVLSDLSDAVFVAAFEMQNGMKPLYGADILAGAAYYGRERKKGAPFFFPEIFSRRAGAYFERYGEELTRSAMAKWYEEAILNARKHPKAQEYHNSSKELYQRALKRSDPKEFLPHLNSFDCSKVTDGAVSIAIASEEGLKKLGIERERAVEIISLGEAEGDITKAPQDLTILSQSVLAIEKALKEGGIGIEDIALLELHDCFSITGLLMLEATGIVPLGGAPAFVLAGETRLGGALPTNLSGGLIGFGHPTGASGLRMLVDLQKEMTGGSPHYIALKKPFGLLISMGGDDKTVTAVVVQAPLKLKPHSFSF